MSSPSKFRWGLQRIWRARESWDIPVALLIAAVSLFVIGTHLWEGPDVARWQRWAEHNPGFFAELDVGGSVAVIPSFHSHAGLVITRTSEGIRTTWHLWFPFDEIPVGFVVPRDAADAWMQLHYSDPDFWHRWSEMADEHGVHVYEHASRGPAARRYGAFLAKLHEGIAAGS